MECDTETCYLCERKKHVDDLFLFDGVGIICIDRVQCEITCKEGERGQGDGGNDRAGAGHCACGGPYYWVHYIIGERRGHRTDKVKPPTG